MDHPEYLIKIFHKWRHSTTFSLLPRARNSTLPCSLTLMASSQRSPSLAGASGWVWSFLGTHPVCFSAGFICKLKVQPTVEKGPPNTVLSLCLPLSSPFFFANETLLHATYLKAVPSSFAADSIKKPSRPTSLKRVVILSGRRT